MIRRWYDGEYAYKFQPAGVRMLHQVPAKVKVAHHFVNDGKRVAGSGENAEKWNDIGMRELTGHQDFNKKPLCTYLVVF